MTAKKEVNSMLNNLIARMYLAARREEGQAMAEYGIILALIAVVAITTLALLGTKIETALTSLTNKL
jgi:pilus assembly protein Flp/PilA